MVAGEQPENKWDDPLINLRVEDHNEPLKELDRLLKVYRAYKHMNSGDLAIEKKNMGKALEEYNAAQKMSPDNLEMKFWTAVSLANEHFLEDALIIFKDVFKKDENWRILVERLPKSELLNLNQGELDRILSLRYQNE